MQRELERLVAREERQITVELTDRAELPTTEAGIVDQIAKASGRKVEATRKVDPDLIGGVVLQAARSASTPACAAAWNDSAKSSSTELKEHT